MYTTCVWIQKSYSFSLHRFSAEKTEMVHVLLKKHIDDSLVEDVLLGAEANVLAQFDVDLLLELLLQLLSGLHAVLARAQHAADATLLGLGQLGDVARTALLQDALQQVRRRQVHLFLRHSENVNKPEIIARTRSLQQIHSLGESS